MQKELLAKNYAAVGEEIGLELGAKMVNDYREANPNDVVGYGIGRNIIEEILAQPGCAGMRFYNAINEEGQKTLVYVGIDATGEDIVKKVVVEQDGTLAKKPGIVADRGDVWGDMIKWITGAK